MVSLKNTSLQAELLRLLGLDREAPPPPENAAETWEPQKMLESLSYYEDLTKKSVSISLPAKDPGQSAPASLKPAQKEATAPKESEKPKPAIPSPSAQNLPAPAETAKAAPQPPAHDETPPHAGRNEYFTLLVGSLRDPDGAGRLLEQLKVKGYPVRIENLDLNAGGRWNRVLVGSFRNRDEALRFAAEFNRKERMEGLIIREAQ